MRFVSWNVNGLRACMQKGFMDFFTAVNADFFCLQETKLQEGQIDLDLPGYEQYWSYAEKKGYSGTAIFTKHTPLSVSYGMGIAELDTEGRLITLEYPEFYLVTCYTPNAQRGLARIEHRLKWEAAFRDYLSGLDSKKPVILCGDLNVAHKEIDLKNPSSNRGNAGFSDEERDAFSKLLECGFTDSFRHLHPDTTGAYTWWSYMFNARQNNAGWRIDYFLVSERIKEQIFSTPIYSDILGSDHCPVGLDMDIACNGGIWPSFENTERPEKKEEIPEKKSSGVKAAAALLCVALLLSGIYFFTPREIPESPATDAPSTTAPSYRPPGDSLLRWNVYTKELSYRITSSSVLSSIININGFIDGEKHYSIDDASLPAGTMNFWIRVDALDPVELIGCDLTANVVDKAHLDNTHTETPAYCYVASYRDDRDIFAGWFIYGYIMRDAYVEVNLSDYHGTLQTANIPVSPVITAKRASEMSTENLVTYAVHLEILNTDLWGINENIQNLFISIWEDYPALMELTFRNDALPLLAEHASKYPSCVNAADRLLRIISGINSQYSEFKDSSITSVMSTNDLITRLTEQEKLADVIKDLLTSTGSSNSVYSLLRQLQPAVQELEKREDALPELLKCYGQSYIIDFLLMQPRFLSRLTISQATELIDLLSQGHGIETVSTDNLIMIITSIADVRKSLLYSAPYNYDQLREQLPAMKELEKRDNTIISLLGFALYERNSMKEQVATAKALLRSEYYYSKMTDYERQLLEMGPILYGDLLSLPLGSLGSEP